MSYRHLLPPDHAALEISHPTLAQWLHTVLTVTCQNGYLTGQYLDTITGQAPYHCVHCPKIGVRTPCTWRVSAKTVLLLPTTDPGMVETRAQLAGLLRAVTDANV